MRFSIGKFESNFKEVEDFRPKSKLANCALAQQANNEDGTKERLEFFKEFMTRPSTNQAKKDFITDLLFK